MTNDNRRPGPTLIAALDAIDLQLVANSPEVVLPRDAAALVACALHDLPDMLAQAWDEGRRIGLTQADYEYGRRLTMPNLTNPYRQEANHD